MNFDPRILQGSRTYQIGIENYGREDVIDQISNHCIVCEPYTAGRFLIVTEKYVICTTRFIIATEDIELFYIDEGLRVSQVTVYDRYGNIFCECVAMAKGSAPKIMAAVQRLVPTAAFDLKPQTQLDYKRRHREDLERNARAMMNNKPFRVFNAASLYPDDAIPIIITFAVFTGLALLRVFDGSKGSIGAKLTCVIIFGALTVLLFIVRARTTVAFKTTVKDIEGEVLDQLNNRMIYAPERKTRKGVYVTDRYIILSGEGIVNREDVVGISAHIYKGTIHVDIADKFGNKYEGKITASSKLDYWREEQYIGSVLPNAVTGRSSENDEYIQGFHL